MDNDFILVLDFGGTQAQAMARKLRAQRYYCEVQPCSIDIATIQRKAPRGMLLAGGPSDRSFDASILSLGIPVLAMGFSARKMVQLLGAVSEGALLSNRASQISFLPCPLFDGLGESDRFFERIDSLQLPEGFESIAKTIDGLCPAFADMNRQLYGLQFYAEPNDPDGAHILTNFAGRICGCTDFWTPEFYIEREIAYIQERIGNGKAIMAISGGVDSTVCAVLMHRAIGDRLRCVFVDNGLLRKGEAETVAHDFKEYFGLEPIVIDARKRVIQALQGITDPQEKRRIVHDEFIRTMQLEMEACPDAKFLVEGTIYPDLLVGASAETNYAKKFDSYQLIEPIRMLFKDEVRYVGEALGVPREILTRQPFPGSGLSIRCIGEVTDEKLYLLREADAIFRAEIVEAGLDRRLTQYFAILTDMRAFGIRDGETTYEYICALRAVNAPDASTLSVAKLPHDLIERVVNRIASQVPGINHVLYDVTGKPFALTEWE